MSTNIKKNDEFEIEIIDTTLEGDGVARHDGIVVFVKGGVTGDIVLAHVIKVKKDMIFAIIKSIIRSSPHRIKDKQTGSETCFSHISYDFELELKLNAVKNNLKKYAKIVNLPIKIIGSDKHERYRNKAQVPCAITKDKSLSFGYFARHSHRVIESFDSILSPEIFSKILHFISSLCDKYRFSVYDESAHKGSLRHVCMRINSDNEIMIILVVNNLLEHENEIVAELRQNFSEIISIYINENKEQTNVIYGTKTRQVYKAKDFSEKIGSKRFLVHPTSFLQVNSALCKTLYDEAKKMLNLTGKETLLDLYSGSGTIGIYLSDFVKSVVGVEIDENAVKCANENIKLNNCNNCTYFCGDAAKVIEQKQNLFAGADIALVDPPRKGLLPEMIEQIKKINAKTLLYISCNSATLARDIALLSDKYEVKNATAVDMFPRTGHVETVVKMEKK